MYFKFNILVIFLIENILSCIILLINKNKNKELVWRNFNK
ncbi:putative membrane protein [Clostridioides difficile CD212]|nr:hypothetical protein HMPREF9945_02208 [Clostridioides difficile 70-100-2010]EQE11142.1 putative membrane protein [Clostridioides difficile CD13]EQE13324.1 putative membrane protein [Clostridioides difficile CD3]EQE13737.1 putative membrane protein [Clostridioides difficile CD8]EQE43459.1 putative membrane protein [Clostridioides difficile CD40]EQE64463.1 putative membrane protein [Clostridioides difficile CD46]EQF12359.1 putative membrane protein [Clostridioides difficile CD133]EQF33242.1